MNVRLLNLSLKGWTIKIMLDLGANIGAIAISVSKLRPDIKIVCLEASPWVFDFKKT